MMSASDWRRHLGFSAFFNLVFNCNVNDALLVGESSLTYVLNLRFYDPLRFFFLTYGSYFFDPIAVRP